MSLIKLNNADSKTIESVLNKELTIFEDIQGSKIYVNWDGKNFTIKPKSLSGEPITILDLATQKYYNKAINFFYSLPQRVLSLMPKKWYFCFEYFPDSQPANIKYDREPKNSLILVGICKNGKYQYDIEELIEFAGLFGCDYLPVIFKGKLNKTQKTAIKYFLNTSEKDLSYVFGERNFAFFFYKLLNPYFDNSFLMKNTFQDNIQKLIITSDNLKTTFEVLNPLYNRISSNNKTNYSEIYSLILLNFLSFIQGIDIKEIKLKGETFDIIYINLICSMFNMYITKNKQDIINFDIAVPEFFDKDKFKINMELISNNLTQEFLDEDDKFEYIFKCILGSFSKKRKKPIGIFTNRTVDLFNKNVMDIMDVIKEHLNYLSDKKLRKSGLVDFNDYYDIKYDIDGAGEVYPSISDEFEPTSDSKKKKGFDDKKFKGNGIDKNSYDL